MAPRRRSLSQVFRAVILAAAAASGGGLAWVQERHPRSSLASRVDVTAAGFALPVRPDRNVRTPLLAEVRDDAPEPARPAPASGGGPSSLRCPADMVAVEGSYCPDARQTCLRWADDDRGRCLQFREPSVCVGGRRTMSYCVDRYEWPNRAGARPVTMATWFEARHACRAEGKRLCSMDEWTFACEGESMLPYPYGYARTRGACTTDHFARAPIAALLGSLSRAVSFREAARVYEAAPSGSAAGCASPFGAMDMVGNVDEWTVNPTGFPYHSALKGGWWGRVRARCRPATLGHYESFRYYNIGFRCCADARP